MSLNNSAHMISSRRRGQVTFFPQARPDSPCEVSAPPSGLPDRLCSQCEKAERRSQTLSLSPALGSSRWSPRLRNQACRRLGWAAGVTVHKSRSCAVKKILEKLLVCSKRGLTDGTARRKQTLILPGSCDYWCGAWTGGRCGMWINIFDALFTLFVHN